MEALLALMVFAHPFVAATLLAAVVRTAEKDSSLLAACDVAH